MKINKIDDNKIVEPKCMGSSKKSTTTTRAHRIKCLIVIMQSRRFNLCLHRIAKKREKDRRRNKKTSRTLVVY